MKFWLDRHGHEFFRLNKDGDSVRGGSCVCHHRLLAYAWGQLDDLFDYQTEIHHKNGVPFDNREENLEPLTPLDHLRLESRRYHGRP